MDDLWQIERDMWGEPPDDPLTWACAICGDEIVDLDVGGEISWHHAMGTGKYDHPAKPEEDER